MIKHMKNILKISFLAIFTFSLLINYTDLQNESFPPVIYTASEGTSDITITTMKDIIEWRYKTVDGNLYMRRYNTSTHSWVGNWIRV